MEVEDIGIEEGEGRFMVEGGRVRRKGSMVGDDFGTRRQMTGCRGSAPEPVERSGLRKEGGVFVLSEDGGCSDGSCDDGRGGLLRVLGGTGPPQN